MGSCGVGCSGTAQRWHSPLVRPSNVAVWGMHVLPCSQRGMWPGLRDTAVHPQGRSGLAVTMAAFNCCVQHHWLRRPAGGRIYPTLGCVCVCDPLRTLGCLPQHVPPECMQACCTLFSLFLPPISLSFCVHTQHARLGLLSHLTGIA